MANVYESVAGIGVDVHYRFSTVTMRDGQGRRLRRERLDHPDRPELRARLSQWPKGVPVVLEASFGWPWLADLMQEVGLQPRLSNCFKLEQMRKARGLVKTNERDSDLLSYLPLERTEWWRVWLPPVEVRDRRERIRYRADLVRLSTQTQNRIHAFCHRHGIFHNLSDLFGAAGRALLAELCRTGRRGEVVLGPGAWEALRGQWVLWQGVRTQLAAVARQLRRELPRNAVIRRLTGIPGIGLILASVIGCEIGDIARFRDHRALACYSLLAPLAHETGERDEDGPPLGRHLGTHGNHVLKWAFIEAAHAAVRSGGKWRKIFDGVTGGGVTNRNRGYIKVGRELAKVVDVVWRKGVEYTDTPPARPGSGRRGDNADSDVSRSGTGQPCVAMGQGPSALSTS